MLAGARIGREFVNAFLADEGRIHVGDEEAFLAARQRLHDHVDRLVGEGCFERGALLLELSRKHQIGRHALVEPAPALDAAEGLRGPVKCGCRAPGSARPASCEIGPSIPGPILGQRSMNAPRVFFQR